MLKQKINSMKKILILSILLIFGLSSVKAGGFQVRLQGQKQTSMGLIGTPMNFGSSSIFYNPGALAMMKQDYSFDIGVNLINSHVLYQSTSSSYSAETNNPLSTPIHIYGAAKLNDKLTVGLGFYTPYGSTTQWDDNWAGKHLIQNISLQAFFVQPTISYKIMDNLSIGAGFVMVNGNVDMQKALPYSEEANVRLLGTDFNYGFNVGVYYQATSKMSIGLDYRSQITMKIEDGEARFSIPESLETMVSKNNKFSAELPLPANLDFGISYQITEKLLAAIEVDYIFWSAYQEISFTFEENGDLLDNTNPREYKDTFVPRLGLEYKLNDMFTFRTGGYYDQTPTNEKHFNPETVSLDSWAYTLGVSIKAYKNLGIDLNYLGIHGKESVKEYESANFEGRYKTSAAIFGIGINYNF